MSVRKQLDAYKQTSDYPENPVAAAENASCSCLNKTASAVVVVISESFMQDALRENQTLPPAGELSESHLTAESKTTCPVGHHRSWTAALPIPQISDRPLRHSWRLTSTVEAVHGTNIHPPLYKLYKLAGPVFSMLGPVSIWCWPSETRRQAGLYRQDTLPLLLSCLVHFNA